MVLLLVAVKDGAGDDSPSIWAPVIEALASVARDTDALGWFEWRAVMGVILPGACAVDEARASELQDRIHRALTERSDAAACARFSVQLHVHRAPQHAGQDELQPIDPLLFPERLSCEGRRRFDDALKRGLDVIGSLALLVVLSPLFLLIAALVKVRSRGPVLFRQVRIGQMMKPFTIFKFRTMHADADCRLHHEYVTRFITSSGEADQSGKPEFFKLTNDPRVSPTGHFLRKTSLDELPQLWNVLRGDMSLVGPRPPIPYELEQYKPWHCRRVLDAKPGITGLWQVSGRSRTTFDDMVRLDLRYARTCSLWTDIKILLATPRAVIAGKGAC
jgi:lipopolysaccharide/colanic/teichoic acid biosynthesis glycosyltransferase